MRVLLVSVCLCVRVLNRFSPPAIELDLNSIGERGDREGEEEEEEEEKREVKETSRTEEKKKLTTCSDKEKKQRSLWLPPWCNVW